MTTSAATGILCAHCGRPAPIAVWHGGLPYHDECTHGPGYQSQPWGPAPLTEADVRRFVREELEQHYANIPRSDNP